MLDFRSISAATLQTISAVLLLLPLCLAAACSGSDQPETKPVKTMVCPTPVPAAQAETNAPAPDAPTKTGLVPANFYNKDIRIELRYATANNFMHRVLYDTLNTAYLQVSAAKKLAQAQSLLSLLKPGYRLLVYDALRPQSVQFEMWNALDTIPEGERSKFVSNPVNGSVHNYAAAIDITITDKNGNPLDMGAGYDDIRKIAYPQLEAQFLSTGELTEQQVENRRLLRKVMKSQGFGNIPTEWWHFNEFPRSVVKQRYKMVRTEGEVGR